MPLSKPFYWAWYRPQGGRRRLAKEQARLQALHNPQGGTTVERAVLFHAARAMLSIITCLLSLVAMSCTGAVAHAQAAPQPSQLTSRVPHAAQQYQLTLRREAQLAWGLSAPVAAFAAQVHQESGWQPRATSQVGAQGMAQFMPATARWWCEMHSMTALECQPSNPAWALRSLVGYDKYLYDRTPEHYTRYDRLWVALRAYNGGLGHWNAEASAARRVHQQLPTRQQADAACGSARRAALHCAESLGYPQRILVALQPRYAGWGGVVLP